MILITGGAGYIGSHTCVALFNAGIEFLILDNFSNSSPSVLSRLEKILGNKVLFQFGDIRDEALLERLFTSFSIDGVMHFAGFKAVGESNCIPLDYYQNNVEGTMCLLRAMNKSNCRDFVFSSSATVYGDAQTMPLGENSPCSATSPYGRTKLMVEEILRDLEISDNSWHIARLRYFNPVGAHPSALIGENPRGIPNNLMPYVAQVANGQRRNLNVFGNDYPTPDGTGVRDYVHVVDLAEGHVAAFKHLKAGGRTLAVNLGTGKGTSVLEMVAAFERASGMPVPYKIVARRPGDVAICFANVDYAREILGWTAKLGIDQMCQDAWAWQKKNEA